MRQRNVLEAHFLGDTSDFELVIFVSVTMSQSDGYAVDAVLMDAAQFGADQRRVEVNGDVEFLAGFAVNDGESPGELALSGLFGDNATVSFDYVGVEDFGSLDVLEKFSVLLLEGAGGLGWYELEDVRSGLVADAEDVSEASVGY